MVALLLWLNLNWHKVLQQKEGENIKKKDNGRSKPEIKGEKRNEAETSSKTNICISNYGPHIKLLIQIKTGIQQSSRGKLEYILNHT